MVDQVGELEAPDLKVDLVPLLEGREVDKEVGLVEQEEFQGGLAEVKAPEVDLTQ